MALAAVGPASLPFSKRFPALLNLISHEETHMKEREGHLRYLAYRYFKRRITGWRCKPASANEVSTHVPSLKGHCQLKNTELCTITRVPGGSGNSHTAPSVIHKVKYFILQRTPLIFRNVIFESYEGAGERHPSRHQLLTKAYITTS